MRPQGAEEVPTADVTLLMQVNSVALVLTGTVLREVRSNWIALDLPPTETWEPKLRQVTPEQRQWLQSSEFYQRLQHHLTKLFLWQRQQQQ